MRNVFYKLTIILFVAFAASVNGAFDSAVEQRTITNGEWTVLENCQLLENRANDGDSFHVMHNGQEYVFRLYYVDCPETYGVHSYRVLDQASYFNIAPEKAVEVGAEASQFTKEQLKGGFTVYTRWRPALGNSHPARHYAFVVTVGGNDLGSLLARQGLVRIHGVAVGKRFSIPITNGEYNHYKHQLYSAQKKAKKEHVGGWVN